MSEGDSGLTVVVTRVIRPGHEAEFEREMREFVEMAWTFSGHRGMQMLRPADETNAGEYTVIARFDSLETRRAFTASPVYAEWMARLAEHSVGAPVVRELTGLDGWSALAGRPPAGPKWKMALVVWTSVFLCSQVSYALLDRVVGGWPRVAQGALVSAVVVAALTWVVLPPATRLLKGWLER